MANPLAPRPSRLRAAWTALTQPAPAAVELAPAPAPSVARARRRRAVTHSAYRGAEVSRLTADTIARTVSPVEQLRNDLRILRARGRDLGLNDGLIANYVELTGAQVLGSRGARLQAQVRRPDGELDAAVNAQIEAAWADFCRQMVTVDGRMNFAQYEQQAFATTIRDGECLTQRVIDPSRRHGLALNGIDPDLLDERYTVLSNNPQQNEIWLGVEVDRQGRRLAYHVFDGPYSWQTVYAAPKRRVPAEEITHAFIPHRLNQARGVTWFAPVMVPTMHLNGYLEAVVVGSRAGADQVAFVEQSIDAVSSDPTDAEGGADGDLSAALPAEQEMAPGMITRLAPGEKLAAFNPTQPTLLFDPFTSAIARWTGTGLGMPYSAFTGDFSKANYSSERAAQQVYRKLNRKRQEWWTFTFRRPVYEWWLETALLSGALRLPSYDWRRYTEHRWLMEQSEWVDPLKDIEATLLELQLGLTSITDVLAERGEDLEEMLRRMKKDRALFTQYGFDLEAMIAAAATKRAAGPAGAGDPAAIEAAGGDTPPASTKQAIRSELATALNGSTH